MFEIRDIVHDLLYSMMSIIILQGRNDYIIRYLGLRACYNIAQPDRTLVDIWNSAVSVL